MEKQHFLQIITNNKGIIKSLCKVYYPVIEDQKDAFQDVVLQLWKSSNTFRGESKISTWIYRVSINTLLAKKRKAKNSITTEPVENVHYNYSSALADDNLELLHILIHSLQDIDKAIVVLHLEGYKNKEIARMLKLSPTNVTTRFNRLKTKLKVKLKTKSHAAK